jgi:hypothetical protein
MSVTPYSEIELVRGKTTDDIDELPDEIIQKYLLEYNHKSRRARVLYAAADCIDYLIRDLEWNTMKVNDRTFSQNIKHENAAKYRARAASMSARIY